MTEQMTPAATDKARKIVTAMRDAMRRDEHAYPEAKFLADLSGYIKDLEALLPPRPTLADMTDDERAACLRMQCDTGPNRSVRGFIAEVHPGGCRVIERDTWEWRSCSDDMVTPRPDLPRMTWPGTENPAPAPALPEGWRLADHPKYGRVIVTNPTPNRDGYVYVVFPDDGNLMGYDWDACPPSALTYIDQEDEDAPTNTLAVGTVIESADDPRIAALPVGSILLDRDEEATTKRLGSWTGVGNAPNEGEGDTYGPWTVLHIPKEADQ